MITEYIKFGKPIIEQIKQGNIADIDDFIQQSDSTNITNQLVNLYIDVGVHFANASFETQKAYIPTVYTKDFLTDKWEILMANFSKDQAFEIFSSIQQTPKDEAMRIVKAIIAEAASSGEGIIGGSVFEQDNISARISRAFGAEWGLASNWMGRRIAQTETIRASNYATLEGVKNLGIEFHKAWLVARDGKERASHAEAGNTQTNVPEHEKFMVSGIPCDYPLDPVLPASESVNCRCAVTAFPPEI